MLKSGAVLGVAASRRGFPGSGQARKGGPGEGIPCRVALTGVRRQCSLGKDHRCQAELAFLIAGLVRVAESGAGPEPHAPAACVSAIFEEALFT